MDADHVSHDDFESKCDDAFSPHKFWISVCAEIRSHPIVGFDVKAPKPANPKRAVWKVSEVWQWLLFEAAWKPRKRIISGCEIYLARGQVAVSQRYLAEAANWGRKAMRLFFERLEKKQMVTLSHSTGKQLHLNFFQLQDNSPEKGPGITIVTICNYDRYQTPGRARGPAGAQQGPSRGPAGAQNLTSNQNTSTQGKVINFSASKEVACKTEDTRCWMDGEEIHLGGELRSYWLAQFNGDDEALKLALIQAAPWVARQGSRPLETRISSQLARIVGDRRERDRRYDNARRQPQQTAKDKSIQQTKSYQDMIMNKVRT